MTTEKIIAEIKSGAVVLEGKNGFTGTQLLEKDGKIIAYLHDKAVINGQVVSVSEKSGKVNVSKTKI